MAKIKGKMTRRGIKAFRGKLDIYYHKQYGWLARQWPKVSRPSPTDAWQKAHDDFINAINLAKTLTTEEIDNFRLLVRASTLTWKDWIVKRGVKAASEEFQIFFISNVTVTRPAALVAQVVLTKDPRIRNTSRDVLHTYRVIIFEPIYQIVEMLNDPLKDTLDFEVNIFLDTDEIEWLILGTDR